MNREQAEVLLAALVAGELNEPDRSELLAYLKTDPALAERLGDMRLAAGLLREGLEQASADAPTAIDDAQRAELLALAEREPIVADVSPDVPRVGLGPLFSIRTAGAIAASVALGVGLLGVMLPELGEVRRSARRMLDESSATVYPNYGPAESASVESYNVIPQAELSDRSLSLYANRAVVTRHADRIDLAAGTRLAFTDGNASHLLNEAAGTLALGDKPSQYAYDDYKQAAASPKGQIASASQPQAPGRRPNTGTSIDTLSHLSVEQSAGDRLSGSKESGRRGLISMAESELPKVVSEHRESVATVGATDYESTREIEKNLRFSADGFEGIATDDLREEASDLDATLAYRSRGAQGGGGDGILDIVSSRDALDGGWAGSELWKNDRIASQLSNAPVVPRYANEPLDDYDTRESEIDLSAHRLDVGRLDERLNGYLDGQQGQVAGVSGDVPSPGGQSGKVYLSDGTQNLNEITKSVGLAMDQPVVVTVDPVPAASASPSRGKLTEPANGIVSLGIDLPFESPDSPLLAGSSDAGVVVPDSFGLAPMEPEVFARRIDDRLEVDRRSKYFKDAFGNVETNTNSGGAATNDLMIQARAQASADKAAQGDKALSDGRFNDAAQLYEDATLLAPSNRAYQDKLAKTTAELNEPVRPQNDHANQLQALAQTTQSHGDVNAFMSIDRERSVVERQITKESEQRAAEEIQDRLREARALQLEHKYTEAQAELDAALFLAPNDPALKGLRGVIQDAALVRESNQLMRARDLEIGDPTLLSVEATTPYTDLLTYPGDWPELTAMRLRELGDDKDSDEADKTLQPAGEPAGPKKADPPAIPPVNPWVLTQHDALSTFALDTDTASYDLARRTIREQAQRPPIASVRMEEFVNRFDYQYPAGRDAHDTFTVHAEAGPAPFAEDGAVLLKVGVRGRVVARDQMKPAHYVFVIDASGSMARADRLLLVQQSLAMLLGQLGEADTVSLVSYETRPYLLLENASASEPKAILDAAATIQTGGSTNLTDGLKLGYQVAAKHFAPGSVNRVILCSDGVANVGDDDAKQMLDAVQKYRQHGVTLMTVGVGVDGQAVGEAASGAERFNDGLMEQLANRGDGQYVYLGSAADAQRQFVEDLAATRPTIAYDAKIQVSFDPSRVRRYRLIGYENRDIADRDFRNDAVDAGEVGSGQSATALYEIELWPTLGGRAARRPAIGNQTSLGAVYVRYRDARNDTVEETATALPLGMVRERTVVEDPRFYLAACAAEFAELLRDSEHATGGSYARLHAVAREVAAALPLDRDAAELAELIGRAEGLPRAGQ